ncbi:MAG: hypothetical protein Q4D45_11700 [Lachnospiraceae bacterium]|nr:hypothetical protein [Lachnospiraceae bacterium]
MDNNWMNDPRIRNISPEKLAVMTLLMEQAKEKTPEEFLPVLLKTSQSLDKAGMSFTTEESNLILDVLTEGMSQEEKQRLALIQSMFRR